MKKLSVVLLLITIFVVTACSKKLVETSIQSESTEHTILIAGDSSEFKDTLRTRIIDTYKNNNTDINVVNISRLNHEDVSGVDAILIMDTCLAWTGFNPSLKSFMKDQENRKKTVLFITAGDPEWTYRYEEIDAITSASYMENEEVVFSRIKSELDRILTE